MERRGQYWFAAQFVLFCGILLAPFIGRFDCPLWFRALGLVILVSGVILAALGYRTLGSSHSPWTNPVEGGHLITTGIYHYLRHPIYSGWIVATVGWALVWGTLFGVGVALAGFIFYDLKSREEERWLLARYHEYSVYQREVRRFIPGI